MEQWLQIVQFPGYAVSNLGRIRNTVTGHILAITANTRGIAIVGLVRGGVQHKRSVAVLVADAFITHARSLYFNTPINLDGNKFNNVVDNLAWRPLWFARKYTQQFQIGPHGFGRRVIENETEEVFEDSWVASITRGVLEREIVFSIMRQSWVFPIYRTYRLFE